MTTSHPFPLPDDSRTSEQVFVDLIKQDLGVDIHSTAWRMFLRSRWDRVEVLAHRIHEGKR